MQAGYPSRPFTGSLIRRIDAFEVGVFRPHCRTFRRRAARIAIAEPQRGRPLRQGPCNVVRVDEMAAKRIRFRFEARLEERLAKLAALPSEAA
jgi:hypothetical protein